MSLLLTGAIIAGACLLRSEYEKSSLKLQTYHIESKKIPAPFDGVRIAVLSDLHNKKFGINNEDLYRYLKAAHPDYILSAGDIDAAEEKNVASVSDEFNVFIADTEDLK